MFTTTGKSCIRRARTGTNPRGFTLAELSIVTLIISIMAAVSVPRYITSLYKYQVDAAARRIKVDLEFLRRNARKTSATRSVVFDAANHRYTMANVGDLDHVGRSDYIVSLNLAPYRAVLSSVDCGGDATLVFNGYGKPDSSATIVVGSGAYSKSVTVESSAGSVSIQ